MEPERARWWVRERRQLLAAVIEKLSGDAHISFEGTLRNVKLSDMPKASEEETPILKRNTPWPRQNFVILPLVSSIKDRILAAIGARVPRTVLHIQIQKAGALEFGAYDQFDPECVFFGSSFDSKFLDALVSDGLLQRIR